MDLVERDAALLDELRLAASPFHLVRQPNRYGLAPFHELHLGAWKKNPNGPFNDWNPTVLCR